MKNQHGEQLICKHISIVLPYILSLRPETSVARDADQTFNFVPHTLYEQANVIFKLQAANVSYRSV